MHTRIRTDYEVELTVNILRYAWLAISLVIGSQFVGCGPRGDVENAPPPKRTTITLQTTTSPRDSGLLDYLLPEFKQQNRLIDVKVIAVGSGQAIENARRGDGDIIIAHSPAAEQKFMDDGFGVSRKPLMENDFIIAGPESDPANVKGKTNATEAFKTIADAKSPFVSRSDESGTHVKEKFFWKKAVVEPAGDWYVEAGVGMADALRIADEKRAYVLTDKGTYLAQKSTLKLVPIVEGDPDQINRYSVIVVSAAKHPHLKQDAAKTFADFLTLPETKRLIAEFGKEKYGESLFRPAP
jgi:tungstate transport system substrate-binding protein